MRKLLLVLPLIAACSTTPPRGISALANADSLDSVKEEGNTEVSKRKIIIENWVVSSSLLLPKDIESMCFNVTVEAGDHDSLNLSKEIAFEVEQNGLRFKVKSGLKKILRRVADDGFDCLLCAKKIDRSKGIRLYVKHRNSAEQFMEWLPK